MSTNSKVNINKIQNLLNQIRNFDAEHLGELTEAYLDDLFTSHITKAEHRKKLLQILSASYKTFSNNAVGKSFSFFRTIIYKQLFKYLHKQIHFNHNINALLLDLNEEVDQLRTDYNSVIKRQSDLAEIERNISQLIDIEDFNQRLHAIEEVENRASVIIDVKEFDRRLNAIAEIQKLQTFNKSNTLLNSGSLTYYSQFGEDEWIVNHLNIPNIGYFLDIGASDGITFSNTYYFEKLGWKGICFEPHPGNYLLAKKYRKVVLPIAITSNPNNTKFEINQYSADWSGLFDSKANEKNESWLVTVKTNTLSDIIVKYKISKIDILSIDTEGTEIDVLQSFDISQVKPTVIIVEFLNRGNSDQLRELKQYFATLPYTLKHKTKSNLIYLLNTNVK